MRSCQLVVFIFLSVHGAPSGAAKPVPIRCPEGTSLRKSPDHSRYRGSAVEDRPPGITSRCCQRPDGTRHGPYQTWHKSCGPSADCQLKKAGAYDNGAQTGDWTTWHGNGQKESEGSYDSGRMHGAWNWWHEDGRKFHEGAYKEGTAVGRHTWWDAQGTVLTVEDLGEDGTGRWTSWYPEGKKKEEGEFVKGAKTGTWSLWHLHGDHYFLSFRETYEDGKRHGTHDFWYGVKNRHGQRHYEHGELHGPDVRFFPDGSRKEEGQFKVGKRHGVWTRWWDNGKTQYQGEFVDGKPVGDHTWWAKDGKRLGRSRLGRKGTGRWTEFDDKGRKKSSGAYKSGLKHGKWRYWANPDGGNFNEEGTYRHGKKDGKWKIWRYMDEKTFWKGGFADDRACGLWKCVRPKPDRRKKHQPRNCNAPFYFKQAGCTPADFAVEVQCPPCR